MATSPIFERREGALADHRIHEQRQRAVREGIASTRIEGGNVTLGTRAIMDAWSQSLLDEETAIARIKALHGVIERVVS